MAMSNVIVFANPKGGTGKTTSALVAATVIAQAQPVTIIDADPNQPILHWSKGDPKPANVSVVSNISDQTILSEIDKAAAATPFVIVDLEGTASTVTAYAMSRADLVVIPLQAKKKDAMQAGKAMSLVRLQEQAFKRQIPFTAVITRTSSVVRSRGLKAIIQDIRDNDIPCLDVELFEREAFDAITDGGTLYDLDPKEVPGVDKAIENAETFTEALIKVITTNSDKGEIA